MRSPGANYRSKLQKCSEMTSSKIRLRQRNDLTPILKASIHLLLLSKRRLKKKSRKRLNWPKRSCTNIKETQMKTWSKTLIISHQEEIHSLKIQTAQVLKKDHKEQLKKTKS